MKVTEIFSCNVLKINCFHILVNGTANVLHTYFFFTDELFVYIGGLDSLFGFPDNLTVATCVVPKVGACPSIKN